jgi:hypothetical protein
MSFQEDKITLLDVDLDEAVAREVLKITILGHAPCWYCEGSWQVRPEGGSQIEIRPIQFQWDDTCHCAQVLYAEMEQEIYKNETQAERASRYQRDFFAGHETICLTAVPTYSRWLENAFEMIRVFNPRSFSLTYVDRLWIAEITDEHEIYTSKMPGDLDDEGAAATVICRAVIKSVRKMGDL